MITDSSTMPVPARQPALATLARNLRWGLAWGVFGAGVSAVIPLAKVLAQGAHALDSFGISAKSLFVSYAIGGVGVGLLVGACRPLLRKRAAAIIIGGVGGLIGFGAIGVAMYGLDLGTYIGMVPSTIVGGALGNRMWERFVEPRLPRPELPDVPEERHPLGRWPLR